MRTVIDRTVQLIRPRGLQLGVSISCDGSANAGTAEGNIVEGDPDQLHRVLLNIVLNAMDAQPNGGQVQIDMDRVNNAGTSEIVVSVSDHGPGLPADLGSRIFDPFVSTKETGVGLGLSTCQQIVESHGGQLSATSQVDGGARFTVRLPAAR